MYCGTTSVLIKEQIQKQLILLSVLKPFKINTIAEVILIFPAYNSFVSVTSR